ncbi:FtsX-like permease family protein [Metabacillus arenae]|uniref:FtsX-like permease family protein n=1 Tax=Metabacillus arenae TaxID=2771434 RepID=A0A926N8Q6_9BACI|nr:FtsX-like permease family protein [Metabacillus arenae]MBD1378749.1 FtsX-like permease family protein [Metabacillus arenae]
MIDAFEALIGPMRYSIIIISAFAFVIGFIIIRLVTNLMIEENTSTIALLKVIGYENKRISSLMLNLYTPVVIFAYLLGVPLGIFSFETMMKSIAEETSFTLPAEIQPIMFLEIF